MNAKLSSIGQYLRQKRKDANLSQNEVGRLLGYKNGQFVSNWERGDQEPPAETLPKLVRIYKINEEELLRVLLEDSEQFYRRILGRSRKRKRAK